MDAETGTMRGAAASNDGCDAFLAYRTTVAVVVVAAVGIQRRGASAGLAHLAAHRWNRLQQRRQLQHVVAVAAGQAHGQRDAVALGDHVVFRARFGAVDRARTGFGPPLSARTWELSITALDQSSWSAACNSASSS